MDDIIKNEAAKVNPVDTWGDLEYQVAGEIAVWIMQQPKKFTSMHLACNAYWNERLS